MPEALRKILVLTLVWTFVQPATFAHADWEKCRYFFYQAGRATGWALHQAARGGRALRSGYSAAVDHTIGPISREYRYYSGRTAAELDAKAIEIFDRVRKNPDVILTDDELARLKANDAVELLLRYREMSKRARDINFQLALWHRSQPGHIDRTFFGRWGNRARSLAMPFIPDRHGNKIRAIYQRLIDEPNLRLAHPKDGEKALDWSDWQLIQKAGLEDDIKRFYDDLEDYRSSFVTLSRIRTWGHRASYAFMGTAAIGAATLNQVGHQHISVEDSLDDDHPDGMHIFGNEMELIFTSCWQMPILIRSGGNIVAFTMQGEMHNEVAGDSPPKTVNFTVERLKRFRCMNEKEHVRVELNLTLEEKFALYKALGDEALRIRYRDYLFGDRRALGEASKFGGPSVPPVFALFPNQAMAYLKARKLLGSETIGKIRYASPNGYSAKNAVGEVALDAWTTALLAHRFVGIGVGEFVFDIVGAGNVWEDKDYDADEIKDNKRAAKELRDKAKDVLRGRGDTPSNNGNY